MFASHLDSSENAFSFYSCHVKWRQIKGRFIYFLVKKQCLGLQSFRSIFMSSPQIKHPFAQSQSVSTDFNLVIDLEKKEIHLFESTGSFLQLFGDEVCKM